MDFDFTEDQNDLRNLVREFLSDRSTTRHVRAMLDDPRGYDPEMYREFVGLGALSLPEQYGGAGLGMIEQAIMLEEIGRAVYPSPFFATVVLASRAIVNSDDENAMARFIPDVCNGSTTLSFAFLEDAIDWTSSAIGATLTPGPGGYTLNGVKRFVPFGATADTLIVAARLAGTSGDDGVTLISVASDAPGITIEPTQMMDQTNKVATIGFENVVVTERDVIGDAGKTWPAIAATLESAAVAASAEMLGASRKALEMSVDYAKVRKQFGQYIGQFQAVKHKLAEMLELVENAHAATYYAAWAQDADAPDKSLSASVAKSTVNLASRRVCGDAIQVHGGIGFTWEYDLHLYFKRAKHLEPLYGDTDFHRERVLVETLAGRVAGVGV
ncbi:MAG: acyl-CoA dehydrogenase [Chloroflexi bacterium]|nr:MAG: acyl-CoA dehydrogenase [Chloroflexota bacterium]